MTFGTTIPEIDVKELALKLQAADLFVLLDVREPWELGKAKITDSRLELAPMSRLSKEGTKALPGSAQSHDALIYVLCHHGVRSAQVTNWLIAQGWKNVLSVRGGIDAYASGIDAGVGRY